MKAVGYLVKVEMWLI